MFHEDATDAFIEAAGKCEGGRALVIGWVKGHGFVVSNPSDPVPQAIPEVMLVKGSAVPLPIGDTGLEISHGIMMELVRRASSPGM